MNANLKQLRVFLVVARQGNFTKAGLEVGLSQPAVSRCVTELEAQLGTKLLERTTREVILTSAGRALFARMEPVLEELDGVLSDVRGLATQRQGRVRIASSPTLSANLLPACIAQCQREYPRMEVLLFDRIQQDALASVIAGEVDFGVVIDPGPHSGLHLQTILTEPFCLVCPSTHPLVASRRVRWADLSQQPLVLLDQASGSRRLIDEAFRRFSVEVKVAQEVGHVTTIFRMLDAGLGVTVVPTLALPPNPLPGLVVKPLWPRVERQVVLARRPSRVLSPLAELAWNLVASVAPGTHERSHTQEAAGA